MGSTRQYDFITGVESSALPAASDPTVDDDFMTKGYADSHYGGGGGGGLTWTAPDGAAPIYSEEYGIGVWMFEPGATQYLVTALKVPANYISTTPIKLKVAIYSPSTSDNVRLRTRTYLVREDQDAAGSTTNLYTSTNTEITNTVAGQYRLIEFDLTDADGEINTIVVTPNDMLRIEVYRDSGSESVSDSEDTRFIPSMTDAKFTV